MLAKQHLKYYLNPPFALSILSGKAALLYLLLIALCLQSCKEKTKKVNLKTSDSSSTNANVQALLNIKQASLLLKDGDLITRSDDDFESLALQNFSQKDRTYSHSGIAFKEDSGFVIYHCMAGVENPDGACRKEPFDSFVNPVKKTGFGIFQYQLSTTETEWLHLVLQQNYQSKKPFDISFNLKTDDSLYCSEMIAKSLQQVTKGRVKIPTSFLHNFTPKIMGYQTKRFFKTFEYIGIDNLYMNPFCKEIIRVKY
jgi:quinol monooxygenase YgiN